jgi:hypothetical protein
VEVKRVQHFRRRVLVKRLANPNDQSKKRCFFSSFLDHLSFRLHLAFELCHLAFKTPDAKPFTKSPTDDLNSKSQEVLLWFHFG